MSEAFELLKQHGYRLTQQRRAILAALTDHPQSVAAITQSLRARKMTLDMATVYRTLDCFVQLGIAAKTQFRDHTTLYELLSGTQHHHHLVCENCGNVEDIPINEHQLIAQVSHHSTFQIKSHILEFFGLCAHCQHT